MRPPWLAEAEPDPDLSSVSVKKDVAPEGVGRRPDHYKASGRSESNIRIVCREAWADAPRRHRAPFGDEVTRGPAESHPDAEARPISPAPRRGGRRRRSPSAPPGGPTGRPGRAVARG